MLSTALQVTGAGVVELTDNSYAKVMQTVKDVKGQQVLTLFYGQLRGCDEERAVLREAVDLLNADGETKGITISQVNVSRDTSFFMFACMRRLFPRTKPQVRRAPEALRGLGRCRLLPPQLVHHQHDVPGGPWWSTRERIL